MKMKKIMWFVFIWLFLMNCNDENENKLTIATAANMQYAIKVLTKDFTKETGIECVTVISSSGKLTAQIHQGAPFDIFLSADMKYPNALFDKKLAIDAPEIYAYGSLILWTTKKDSQPSIESLSKSEVNHIALASPITAPYGVAATEVLNHFNLFKKVESRLVYGESIAQTNQFITTQAADLGFTSKSVLFAPTLKEKGQWIEIPANLYTPIAQGLVILKSPEKNTEQAQKFKDFLISSKGKEILNNFGYKTTKLN